MITSTISVLVVDDHQLMRERLRELLSQYADITVVGEAEDGFQALTLCQELRPDVIILDISMPDLGGFEVLWNVADRQDAPKIVICSFLENLEPDALEAGASAFVVKERAPQMLVPTIRSVV